MRDPHHPLFEQLNFMMTTPENSGKLTRGPNPVYLIPWDPDSQEHVDRMKLQRIACGWKVDQVDAWRETQRNGQSGLHWVVSACTHQLP